MSRKALTQKTDWIIENHGKILSQTPWRDPSLSDNRFADLIPADVEVKVEWPGYFDLVDGVINDVRMPLFVLAVFYAGLFAILGDKQTKGTMSVRAAE